MKTVLLLIVLAVVARVRLPEGKPCMATIGWSEEATMTDKALISGAVALAPASVEDYGVIKIANLRCLGITFVADPITGQWHRM